jgi:hypothetical protein
MTETVSNNDVIQQALNVTNQSLAALPKTSRGIANFLRRRGIKGRRGVAKACPIHNYLRTVLDQNGLFREVQVAVYGGRNVLQVGAYGEVDFAKAIFETPTVVDEFIDDFDQRQQLYEFLVEEEN